jgi:hypothetical protein
MNNIKINRLWKTRRKQKKYCAMENNELYELYYKIALDVAKKQKGTKGSVCVDTTFETALEFAKQYKKLSEGNPADLKNANCAIFDVSAMLPDEEQAMELQRKVADNFTYTSVNDEPKISCNGIIAIIEAWEKMRGNLR